MYINGFLSFILSIPFFWVFLFDHQNLKKRSVFINYLLISIVDLFFGISYDYFYVENENSFVYFTSQMSLIFIILYKLIRIPYYQIFRREPEISKYPKYLIDIVPTLIVLTGTIILPFLIKDFIVKKILN